MATISKQNNNIVIQTDNSSQPSIHSDWKNASVTYGTDYVTLSLGNNNGFMFTADWGKSPIGALTEVNGVDVTGNTNAEIADLIRNNVLTPDQFSGTPKLITGTTAVAGQFTAIYFETNSVLNVTPVTGTIQVDGFGDPITMTPYTGISQLAGTTIYGKFTQIQLVSGDAIGYSNL
jgi:hypothetical protein